MKYLHIYLVMASMLTSGCSERGGGGLINSFNHHYEYEEIRGESGPLYKALSLTGLLPTQKLGIPYYFSLQEGVDSSFEIGGEKTLYIHQTVGDTITLANVRDVSQKILQLKQAGNKAFHAKLNHIKARKDKDATLADKYLATYQSTQADLDKAYSAVMAALKPGIVILQWGNSGQDQDSFNIGSGNGFRYNYNNKFKGLLVLGGIRVSTLAIGKDFCSRIAATSKGKDSCSLKQNLIIPTYLLQTRHLVFMDQANDQERDSVIAALDEALKSDALSVLDKLELESIHKQAYSLFTLGELSGIKTSYEPGYMETNKDSSWTTVYAVLPSTQNLYSKLNKWCL